MILVGLLVALACGLAVGIFNYVLILLPAHPADHRDAVVELPRPVDRDRLWPRPAHQAAAAAGRFHHRADRRHAGARHLRRRCLRPVMGVVLHRTVYGRSVIAIGQNTRAADLAGIQVERIRFVTYVLERRARRAVRLPASRASRAARRCRWASNICSPRSPSWSSAAPRSPAATAIFPGLWGAALFLFLVAVDAQHLPALGAGCATSPPASSSSPSSRPPAARKREHDPPAADLHAASANQD